MPKQNKQLDKNGDDAGYRIGAIASLTSISPDVLRVWEKRYGLIHPRRTATGNRVYREEDLTRLSLIKNLLDAALHAYLYKTTAQARHSMETALAHLLEVEKITIS